MTSTQAVRIADFCKTGSGGTPSRSQLERYYEGGTIPWIKSGELREAVINSAAEYVTEAALKESSIKLVPAGAILLAMYGATVGRLGILGIEATTNQAVCHIVPDPKVAATRYVYHAISSRVPNLIAMGVGGAQPNINQAIIKDLAIHLPPLPEQIRIAAILDQADVLRVKRREALAQLDSLTQSIFIDMFGDPATNPRGWQIEPFGSVCENQDAQRIPVKSSDRDGRQGAFPYYGASGIIDWVDDYIYEGERLLIGEDGANLLARATPVAYIARGKFWVNNHAHVVAYSGRANLRFMEFFIEQIDLKPYISGSAQPKLNRSNLDRVPVMLPPLEMQHAFAERIALVEKLKTDHSASLAEFDTLFVTLQHRAFRGEL